MNWITEWQRTSNKRSSTSLGEKIVTLMLVVFLLIAGLVVFEFAATIMSLVRDILQ